MIRKRGVFAAPTCGPNLASGGLPMVVGGGVEVRDTETWCVGGPRVRTQPSEPRATYGSWQRREGA